MTGDVSFHAGGDGAGSSSSSSGTGGSLFSNVVVVKVSVGNKLSSTVRSFSIGMSFWVSGVSLFSFWNTNSWSFVLVVVVMVVVSGIVVTTTNARRKDPIVKRTHTNNIYIMVEDPSRDNRP